MTSDRPVPTSNFVSVQKDGCEYGCAGGSEYKDVPVNDDSRTLPEFHQIMFLVRRNFSEGLWQVVKEG